MEAEGNIIKQRSFHKSNFTICHNEILFQKKENGDPISLEALGLFWRLMSLPPKWRANYKGLAKICGCNKDRITKLIKELGEFGYVQIVDNRSAGNKFNGKIFILHETQDQTLWKSDTAEELIDMANSYLDNQYEKPYPEFPELEKTELEFPELENQHQYNINIYKENNNKNINNNLSENDLKVITEPLNSEVKNKSIKDNLSKMPLVTKQSINNAHLAPKGSQNSSETEKVVKTAAQLRAEERQRERNLANEQKRLKEQQKQSVDNFVNEKFSDMTEEDNILAQTKKMLKEVQEEKAIVELQSQKRSSKKKRIFSKIDKEITNIQLGESLKNFFGMWVSSGKPLSNEVYEAQIINLNNLSNDVNEQIKIVNRSVQKGWLDLYSLNNDKNKFKVNAEQQKEYEAKIKQEYGDDAFELATDENGNPLVFG